MTKLFILVTTRWRTICWLYASIKNNLLELKKTDNYDALIIGVDSSIGDALFRRLTDIGQRVVGTTRRPHLKHLFFDLAEPEKIDDLPFARHIFICAGINGFKACEENIDLATKVNFISTCQIAKHFMMLGSHVIFFSSSSVFGSNTLFPMEDSMVDPSTHYGRLKVLAENQMRNDALCCGGGKLTIIRLTKVLESLAALIDGWVNIARSGGNIEAFIDLYLCPISMRFILDSIIQICKDGIAGVIHLSGNQIISYYDFAKIHQTNGLLINANIIGIPSKNLPKLYINQCISLGMDRTKNLIIFDPENLRRYN